MRPGFSSLSGLIHEGLRHYQLEQGVKAAQAVNAWPKVAGPVVAAVTQADIVRDGVLYVFARSNAWSQELLMLREQLVAALNRELGGELVKDIRFRVKRITAAPSETEPAAKPPRVLTDSDRKALDDLVTRLAGDTENQLAEMARKQMTRPDREGICPVCGGPMDIGHTKCPFCR